MPSKQLMSNLAKDYTNSSGFQEKQKLTFNEKKLDYEILNKLKLALVTKSTKKAVETIFTDLATDELKKKQSIYKFPSSDYLDKIEYLSKLEQADGAVKIHIPRWTLIATSELIKDKYKKFEFTSIDEVIDTLIIKYYFEKIQYLWNPQL